MRRFVEPGRKWIDRGFSPTVGAKTGDRRLEFGDFQNLYRVQGYNDLTVDRGESGDGVVDSTGDRRAPETIHLHRDATGTYRAVIEDTMPSTAVVLAVASLTGRDEEEIDQLGAVINPDALDTLFTSRLDGTERLGGRISFQFSGFEVTIERDELLLAPVSEE